uniref:Putative f-box/lrr protein drome n=1 Tax=Culex tarsalis TaxID=7177 RepID=A0A1Q3F8T1_CULTA
MADHATDEIDGPTDLTLFDIAWEDVLFAQLLPLLSLSDLFNLRCCSRLSKQLVDGGLRSRRVINLSGNNSRNIDRAFRVLSRKCRNVRTANLAKCSWLSDGLLAEFLRANTKIRQLNLSDCVNVTPVGLHPIIIDCKQLSSLKLARCSWLTIGAMEALTLHHSAPEAHGIVELDISHCVGLNERCISIFLLNMRQLRTLAVAYIPAVTDNLLYSIAKNAKAMRHLNIIGCQLTTDRGVGALSLYCTELESLMVRDCPCITERSLSLLRGRVFIDRPRNFQQLNVAPNVALPRLYLQV